MTYYSRSTVVYTGGDAIFSIPFPYSKEDYVEVYINGVQTTNFEFLTTQSIRINATLATNDKILIKRNTSLADNLVEFTDTSILKKDTQNLAKNQTLYAVQEAYDKIALTPEYVETTESFDMKGKKLTNVANGISATDAVTKSQLDTVKATADYAATNVGNIIAGQAIDFDPSEAIEAHNTSSTAHSTLARSSDVTTAINSAVGALVIPSHVNGSYVKGTASGFESKTPAQVSDDIGVNPDIVAFGTVSSGTKTLTADKIHTASITGSCTLALPTGLTGSKFVNCMIDFSLASGQSVTLPTGVKWNYGVTPTISTTTGVRNRLIFDTDDNGTTWNGYYSQLGA